MVFEALPHSSLAPHEQLERTFDALLRDQYDLCQGADEVLHLPYPPDAWNIAADTLLEQLDEMPTKASAGNAPRDYAVAKTHPTRAAAIWQQLVEGRIAQTSPSAYQEAAIFLRKLWRLWARQNKAAEWRAYVERLRETNKRKRRLVETLDALLREAAE